jgi:hypothetical protein
MKKLYELPSITTIGSVQSLTQVNKCGGSGDWAFPQQLNPNLTTGGCTPSP